MRFYPYEGGGGADSLAILKGGAKGFHSLKRYGGAKCCTLSAGGGGGRKKLRTPSL